MHAVIYHNPRCSKSRATLALLQQHGVRVETIDYLAQPPSTNTLRALLAALDLPVTAMVRFTEARAAQLGLRGDDSRAEEEWLQLLHANPILLERPIVVVGTRAAIGRPPDNVLALLPHSMS